MLGQEQKGRFQVVEVEPMKLIIVASRDRAASETIRACFGPEYRVEVAFSKEGCLTLFRKKRCEFLFIDMDILFDGLDSGNGGNPYKTCLQPFWQIYPSAEIIVISTQEKIRHSVMAVKAGASNYITYPVNADEVKHVTENLYNSVLMRSELDYLRDKFWQGEPLELFKTNSPLMERAFEKVQALAPTNTTVLLTGETGTGKGLIAKLIHRHSARRNAQFITIHCGAIPDSLLESELFGHEKGAFTGADRRKLGKFEIAQKGTIFLDEIGTMTPSAQIKLLQVLQERTFQRVGGEVTIEADVRIIVATNADLKQMSENGLFRKDLYYRLNVFPIELPPLRDRIEDLPHISDFILQKLNKMHAKEVHDIDPRVMAAFEKYSWPGNIRELENILERAYLITRSSVLTPESFPAELFSASSSQLAPMFDVAISLADMRQRTTETYLRNLLTHHKGRIQKTADAAGISTRQLHKLMSAYGLKKEAFKSAASVGLMP
jgi:DNA-binding NtrC family response regulator